MRTDMVIEVLEVRTVDPDEARFPADRPSRPAEAQPVVLGGPLRRAAGGRRRRPR
jgi:hypothetical protein